MNEDYHGHPLEHYDNVYTISGGYSELYAVGPLLYLEESFKEFTYPIFKHEADRDVYLNSIRNCNKDEHHPKDSFREKIEEIRRLYLELKSSIKDTH